MHKIVSTEALTAFTSVEILSSVATGTYVVSAGVVVVVVVVVAVVVVSFPELLFPVTKLVWKTVVAVVIATMLKNLKRCVWSCVCFCTYWNMFKELFVDYSGLTNMGSYIIQDSPTLFTKINRSKFSLFGSE